MRWKRGRRSSNIEDRRGARLRTGLPNLFPGRRGGTASRRPRGRGGLVVTVLVLLGLYFLGVDPRLLLQSDSISGGPGSGIPGSAPTAGSPQEQELADFVSVVLADTEDTWTEIFRQSGKTYQEPNLVLYTGATLQRVGARGLLFIGIAAFAIVATSNAVNITDGLDGLAGGTLIFAFIGYMVIAFTFGQPNLAEVCALIIGALLAFLWFNVHPAQIFMGDSGSLALGATLAVTAVITGQLLLLPLIGLVFVMETGSVILQVASVKLRGKRIFKMSPLHHHFELAGWDEEKITLRFWIVAALAALVGVAFYMATVGLLN